MTGARATPLARVAFVALVVGDLPRVLLRAGAQAARDPLLKRRTHADDALPAGRPRSLAHVHR